MKNKIFSIIVIMLFVQSSLATTHSDQPNACPSLSNIKSVGIQNALNESDWGWIGFTMNQYSTNVKWTLTTFIQGQFDNEEDAIKQANTNLSFFTSVQGPIRNDEPSRAFDYVCFYSGEEDLIAIAFTPPISPPSSKEFISSVAKYRR